MRRAIALGWRLLAAGALLLLQACATVAQPDARDPLESFNRGVFVFNDSVDRVVLKPVATVYRDALPDVVQQGVRNFFANLEDVWSAVNNGLQGRGEAMGNSLGRVMVNSTIGVLGLFDVATQLNIERRRTNFGMTLGQWGVPPGPYVMLPLLGPATLREVAALPVDVRGNLVNQVADEGTRTGLTVVDVVDTRSRYLDASEVLENSGMDKYVFTRNAYLQRQRNRQYDGNPPDEEDPEP